MAKGNNQKLKLLYLMKIFLEETDDQHALTLQEIAAKLAAYDVEADRKTLYRDFEDLRLFGLDILGEQVGRNYYYHIGSRDFELPELKLLVDSVQSAKFISDRKSKDLIRKLEALVSRHEAKLLDRQVVISGRVKTMNESIYYNVDKLHEAIGSDRQIRFKYFQWNVNKEMELRRGGEWYRLSPWGLMWDDENYYLVAFDSDHQEVRHYRVDKMLQIGLLDEKREGRRAFEKFDMPHYTKSLFGMFGGEKRKVTIEADNSMAGIMIDRFGKDIIIVPAGPDRFQISVTVAVSNQFFGWIIALGDKVKITAPASVVDRMRAEIQRLSEQYQ